MADPEFILVWRVALKLYDPDAGYPVGYAVKEPPERWPRLTARLLRLVGGPADQVGYLAKLDFPLPPDFDPLSTYNEDEYGSDQITHFALFPQANMVTADIPKDYVAESLMSAGVCSVIVVVGAPPEEMPMRIRDETVDDFRYIMDAEIRRIPEPAADNSES